MLKRPSARAHPSRFNPNQPKSGWLQGPVELGTSELGTWNLEVGTWKLELAAWNLTLGIWNLELGIGNLELGTMELGTRRMFL